jgi:hypothetical protein
MILNVQSILPPDNTLLLLSLTWLLTLVPAIVTAEAPSAMEKTSSTDAEELASQWQRASAKYKPAPTRILAEVDRQAHDGRFRPDWGSLSRYEVPEWYKDAMFGIFIHWGLYSVPAFGNEWYPREMYLAGSAVNKHHVETYGPLTKFAYKDFIPMFKAEQYDPQAWARLFKQAGAQYVVPVFEHHDGIAMYDSSLSDWTAAKMGQSAIWPAGVITYKHVDMQKDSGVLDIERGQLSEIRPSYWQTDTSVSNNSWGYIEHDTFKTPSFIVHQLVDVVSKSGNPLMNSGSAIGRHHSR